MVWIFAYGASWPGLGLICIDLHRNKGCGGKMTTYHSFCNTFSMFYSVWQEAVVFQKWGFSFKQGKSMPREKCQMFKLQTEKSRLLGNLITPSIKITT